MTLRHLPRLAAAAAAALAAACGGGHEPLHFDDGATPQQPLSAQAHLERLRAQEPDHARDAAAPCCNVATQEDPQ